MHAGILPSLLVAFLALHIYCFRRHGLTVHDEKHAPDTTFWPDQVLKDAVACLAVLAVVLMLAVLRPAELSAPADAGVKFDAARPEWYFLFLFRFLRFHAVESLGLTFGAIVVPGIIMGILTIMPITAQVLGKTGHFLNKAFIWLMAIGIAVLTVMAFYEDANDPGHQAALAESHRDGQRAIELASGPDKIPVDGAVSLLRRDPFTQGPRLFAQHCAACHRYNGHTGRGTLVFEKGKDGNSIIAAPTAADLGTFGRREWMNAIVTDYATHFSWIKNARWYQDAKARAAAGESVEFLNPEGSEMADWTSGNVESLMSPENADNVKALVEFLTAEAGHVVTTYDPALVEKGRSLATEGTWEGALNGTSCKQCHDTIGDEFPSAPDDSNANGYPTMAKYGSALWLKDFIRNPGAARHYGAKNAMTASTPEKLSDQDLDLLVRWMTGDYVPSTVPDYSSRIGDVENALKTATAATSPDLAAPPAEVPDAK
jgi:ubiquinol-cytochrome c reductase cytochrome b subunit